MRKVVLLSSSLMVVVKEIDAKGSCLQNRRSVLSLNDDKMMIVSEVVAINFFYIVEKLHCRSKIKIHTTIGLKTLLNKLTRHAIILDVFLTFPSNNWFMWLKLHRLLREEHCNRGEIEDSEIYQSIEAVIYSRQHSEDQTFDIDSYDIHLCQDLRNKDWGGTIKWNQIYQFYLSLMLKMFFFSITNLQSDTRIDSFFLSASSSSIFHSLNFIGGFDCVICISIPL